MWLIDSGDVPTPEESAWNQVKGTAIAFPMARVKKIIKADPDVRTVNKEATMLIAKTTVKPHKRRAPRASRAIHMGVAMYLCDAADLLTQELVVMKLAEASMQVSHSPHPTPC